MARSRRADSGGGRRIDRLLFTSAHPDGQKVGLIQTYFLDRLVTIRYQTDMTDGRRVPFSAHGVVKGAGMSPSGKLGMVMLEESGRAHWTAIPAAKITEIALDRDFYGS